MDPISSLQNLLSARGPCGQEDEVRDVCRGMLEPLVDELSTDPAGNLIGFTKGEGEAAPVRVMVHMDELSLLVKRVEKEGKLRVSPLGGLYPSNLGQGPVDILGDDRIIPGIISAGPMHVSKESKPDGKKAAEWKDLYVQTRLSEEELAEAGVHAGTRVVVAKERRKIFQVGDCLGGYFMDNRAAIMVALLALQGMKAAGVRPAGDVYTVCSTSEEIGGVGACYAARTLPGEIALAIDVGPVAEEYGTVLSADPIVVYKDAVSVYDRDICRDLLSAGKELGIACQTACWESYGSDGSIPKKYGQAPRAALICFPTENTHGYEMIHRDAMESSAKLLQGYLCRHG